MIFHKHKAIFFHIAKAAGTAVEKLLAPGARDASVMDQQQFYGYDKQNNLYLQHVTAQFMHDHIDKAIFEDYFKFAVVRNPFVRCVSVYHYQYEQHMARFGSFDGFVRQLPILANNAAAQKGSHYSSQTTHTHIDGIQACDHICHFEDLPTSLDPVRQKLGITQELEKHNTHRWLPWGDKTIDEYYTPETIKIVSEVYQADFENFGYSKDIDNLLPI